MKKLTLLAMLVLLISGAALLTTQLVAADSIKMLPAKVLPADIGIRALQKAIDSSPVIERVIVPEPTILGKISYWIKGCKAVQQVRGEAAYKCSPQTARELIASGQARIDRIFQKHDLKADVQINADDVWSSGYNGAGVLVAILDTGVDSNHIELSDSIVATENFINGPGFDGNGHGTHVSGIVTANGVYEIEGNYATGVAPGADIIVGKVCGSYGCYESDMMAGIEWAVAQGARVLSMSIGGDENYGDHCDDDPLAAKVNWAVSQGLVVAISSGNDGAGVSSPACASGAIAVGATYHKNYSEDMVWFDCTDVSPDADDRACWSNYGSALDLVAPGVDILSTYSCKAAGDCRYYWYVNMSGTSMSAPHVAGTAALILEKNPHYTVAEVKEALYSSAKDLGGAGWDQYYGHGRIDAMGAVHYSPTLVDNDGDNYTSDVDCNDNDPAINPGAAETCNGVDDDCDGLVDEGFDMDDDGYTICGGDCDDNNAAINPGAPETGCNGVNDDCDLFIDEDYISYTCGVGACQMDSICASGAESCTEGTPEIEETCGDSIDNDCDGETDEGCEPTAVCGDNICAGYLEGEDCFTCPSDCRGTGKNNSRSCCGDGVCINENVSDCSVDCG